MPSPPPPPATDALVELIDAGKQFPGGSVALEGFSLSLGRGEFVSLVGPSGCGKSTALRLVAGLDTPTAGSLRWAPDIDRRRDVAFVFQEPTLPPWRRVAPSVALPLELRGEPRPLIRQRVAEALALVGLADFAHAYPRQLSGGMKMRVAIARALVTRPKLLLMDEPFAALDEITRTKLNNDLLRLWQAGGWTVLFVTHSVYESVYLSQRVLTVAARPGRVVAEARVSAGYPRDESFRRTPEYCERCAEVSASLRKTFEGIDRAE